MNIYKLIAENNARINMGMIKDGFIQITVSNHEQITQNQVSPQTIAQGNADIFYALVESLINSNIRKATEKPSQEQSKEAEGTEDIA